MIIGLDIGGSTTKIVTFLDQKMTAGEQVRADDPVASAYGALGKVLNLNGHRVGDVRKLFITGVGASFIRSPLLGIETHRVEEVRSIGLGGCYVSGLDRAVVVSMGTGTAIVEADRNKREVSHLIGSGVGGGTLLGLARAMLGTRDIGRFARMAEAGDLSQVDLSIEDISRQQIAGLGPSVTASNFGKVVDETDAADIAAGIVNLVFQTVGILAVAISRGVALRDIVFTGNLIHLKTGRDMLKRVAELYEYRFHLPPEAEYATAIGAALHAFAPPIEGDELL